MTTAALIERLQGVKQTGPDRWLARCPSHEDKRPSLSIRERGDGRTLVHCFGGCDADAVVTALGLQMSDLFPERLDSRTATRAPRIPAGDILAAIAVEIEVVLIAAASLARGEPLIAEDHDRLRLAVKRLRSAVEVANGAR